MYLLYYYEIQQCDVYVMDAFGVCHRDHASVSTVARFVPLKFPGLLVHKEVQYLTQAMWGAKRPLACVIGGAKVADKIGVLRALVSVADKVIIGGRMAFTFLLARGVQVGSTVVETERVADAVAIAELAEQRGCQLLLPSDVIVGDTLEGGCTTHVERLFLGCCSREKPCIASGLFGGDIGPETCRLFSEALDDCSTIFWNGPMGKFEVGEYLAGTRAVAEAMDRAAARGAVTIVGGGDSVSALEQLGLAGNITHVSTGGGASLELIEGRAMPGLRALV
jgi:phosphoglycerate kinase